MVVACINADISWPAYRTEGASIDAIRATDIILLAIT